MKRPLHMVRRCLSFMPASLLMLGTGILLLAGTIVVFLPAAERAPQSESPRTSMPPKQISSIQRRCQIRFHLAGPGRATNWATERIRQFQFVQELKYRTDMTSATSSSFTERRKLNRHRFLLISAPPENPFSLDWNITEILQTLGSSDQLLSLGKEGYPVGPVEPETLSEGERSRLMNFMEGDERTSNHQQQVIRFISPHEGKHFTLHHTWDGRSRSISLADTEHQISGLDRDVLMNAPVIPERLIPNQFRRHEKSSSAKPFSDQPFSITGIDQYLQSFFPCRLTGEATLRKTAQDRNRITFRGSGSFNILHPSRSKLIGELRLRRIKFVYQHKQDHIRTAQLHGRIAMSSFPNRHVLNRITFLRKPDFRISYQSDPGPQDE